jgi:hypothetical protein
VRASALSSTTARRPRGAHHRGRRDPRHLDSLARPRPRPAAVADPVAISVVGAVTKLGERRGVGRFSQASSRRPRWACAALAKTTRASRITTMAPCDRSAAPQRAGQADADVAADPDRPSAGRQAGQSRLEQRHCLGTRSRLDSTLPAR